LTGDEQGLTSHSTHYLWSFRRGSSLDSCKTCSLLSQSQKCY